MSICTNCNGKGIIPDCTCLVEVTDSGIYTVDGVDHPQRAFTFKLDPECPLHNRPHTYEM